MKHHKQPKSHKSSLESLTAAALILPGLLQAPAYAADDDEVDFQYSHYQEGRREIWIDMNHSLAVYGPPGSVMKAPNPLNPIEVDSLHGSARTSLTDRVKFGFNYTQDTWGGATPIASAPVVTSAMQPNNMTGTDTLVGASPLLQAVSGKSFLDLNGNWYDLKRNGDDPATGSTLPHTPGALNNRIVHTLVSASPETRQQGDFKLSYDGDDAAVNIGGGLSVENDYESRFGNVGLRLDFNQKRTSVNWGLSYTNSDTQATMDPYSYTYTSPGPYEAADAQGNYALAEQLGGQLAHVHSYSPRTEGTLLVDSSPTSSGKLGFNKATITGNRQDWGSDLGLTQVLTKNTELELGLGYTHSAGYLSNPYKAVYVFSIAPAPNQNPNAPLLASGFGQMEARPHERNQFTGNVGLHYYLDALDAGLHGRYKIFHDDWDITSHSFDADWVQSVGAGWTITPNVRYYSQSAADFYAPFFTTVDVADPDTGVAINSPLNKALPNYYSSDQRLSGFGALSGGVTIAKQFAKGIKLETGFEYYSHQGGLKLGGGGEQDFADFNYWTANAALKVNLGALHFSGGSNVSDSSHHTAHLGLNPAGLMFDHALAKAGDSMVGYRYMRNEQAGSVLTGSTPADKAEIITEGCGPDCTMLPKTMTMNMHMLELMVAPTDWLTLMLMPQWTDMAMTMSHLGVVGGGHHTGGGEKGIHAHQTGGIGDTGLYTLFKLFEQPGQQLVLSLGGSAPTGAIDMKIRRNSQIKEPITPNEPPLAYDMQLGSGTWDLKPSLTYSGTLNEFGWGAQATGTKRLDRNSQHYALGDIFQGSVWGGYQWTHWLSSTVRGIYTWQDQIRGHYPDFVNGDGTTTSFLDKSTGTSAKTSNYGGRFVDLGLGVNVTIPSGTFAGNTLKFEWLQPLHTDYNGYQLDRDGALTATWGVGF